ncbi:MAG: DNA polymerase III subunit delta' [Acidiferrobacterales bacterium]
MALDKADSEGPYPWHCTQWAALTRDPMRLSHALLLRGQPGLGKYAFAKRLARALLCARSGQGLKACGLCKSCRLYAAGTHPDFAPIEPAEEGRAITVDQVRALVAFATTRPHTADRKVVIIRPADAMNLNAANSLLKVLEEPPLGNVLILISSEPAKLPATVRSRCQRVDFKPPSHQDAIAWLEAQSPDCPGVGLLLELAGGAPLRALELAEADFLRHRHELFADICALSGQEADPVSCAARWHRIGTVPCLGWLQGLIADLVKLAMASGESIGVTNADLASDLHTMSERLNLQRLYWFADTLAETRDLLTTPVDDLLLLEDILIGWTRLTRE